MLHFLPAPVVGVIAALLLLLNTLVWVPILLAFSLLRLLLPFEAVRRALAPVLAGIAESWIACNSGWMALTQRTAWDVDGLDGLDRRHWYLVNCNHQSWVDVFVLQHVFNRRIPLLKFFLKKELMWVPAMGLAWWALDFPFMRRHSETYLKENPHMRGKDLETARKACQKFALNPTSVMNFLEGTRFTETKKQMQSSPYKHLLKPKIGGIALTLNAIGERFEAILDVTIVYPDGAPTLWQFLCGKVPRVVLRVQRRTVPENLQGADYTVDPRGRAAFRKWVRQLWLEKDRQITALLQQSAGEGHGG